MLNHYRHIHLIGIGGSGLSALAHLALRNGLKTTGSDSADSALVSALREEGAIVHIGHTADNLPAETDLVIYSEAIDKLSNPEYLAAKERELPIMSYFEALGALSREQKTIAVTGTHGKTTTTAMLGQAIAGAGKASMVILGAKVPAWNSNLYTAPVRDGFFVAEACEYRRSFLSFDPFGMVLLNCELEHTDYYKSEDDYLSAFRELAAKIPKEGFIVYNADDPNAVKVAESCAGKKIPVGMADAERLNLNLKVAGKFNQLNAALALATAKEVCGEGQAEAQLRNALEAFAGTSRRMETKGQKNGALVMDDYGHHPTEVKATLEALKEKYPEKRLICVFQPHQYSRTRELLSQFRGAFTDGGGKPLADLVIVPNIYEARDSEEDKAAVSAESFVETLREVGVNARFGDGPANTLNLLREESKEGDLILTMGAGDVYKIGDALLAQ